MVLERLVSLKDAINNPTWMFVIGGIVSVTCLVVSSFIFQELVGWYTTILITITMTPFMLKLTTYEEAKEEEMLEKRSEMSLFERHKDTLKIYTAFFCGMILSFSILYIILPENFTNRVFADQVNKINEIRGMVATPDTFFKIITNNLGVLFLSFLLSFLLGAGAILILAWNATILSSAIGMAAKSIGGIKGLPMATIMFLPHGSLEILAYFIAGIAGGIISAALTRRKSKMFFYVIKDSLMLVAFSTILLLIAGGIEIFML